MDRAEVGIFRCGGRDVRGTTLFGFHRRKPTNVSDSEVLALRTSL